MRTQEILQTVAAFGGRLWVEDGNLRMRLPENLRPLTEHIRERKAEILQTLSREASHPPETTLAEWDPIFTEWTSKRCSWKERSYGNVSMLYIDCCEWSTAHGYPLVPDLRAFESVLTQLGMEICDGLVYGLLMAEDACLVDTKPLQSTPDAPVSPDAVKLDNLYTLPSRKPAPRRNHVIR